jgi:transcriptional regulator with XRE-family HTH domain
MSESISVPEDPSNAQPYLPGVSEQVGLALRAYRRAQGWSQRALAAQLGVSQTRVARAETRAASVPLGTLVRLLGDVGFTLAVVRVDGRALDAWDETDLLARDRRGRRFPATRVVRRSSGGPRWWWYHEVLGRREYRRQPTWTAEGFPVPASTRYGRPPRPYLPGEGTRWPH